MFHNEYCCGAFSGRSRAILRLSNGNVLLQHHSEQSHNSDSKWCAKVYSSSILHALR